MMAARNLSRPKFCPFCAAPRPQHSGKKVFWCAQCKTGLRVCRAKPKNRCSRGHLMAGTNRIVLLDRHARTGKQVRCRECMRMHRRRSYLKTRKRQRAAKYGIVIE